MSSHERDYDLASVFPVEDFTAVDPGTNLLLVGPDGIGKRGLGLELLAAGARHDEGSLVIATDWSVGDIANRFLELVESPDGSSLTIIDCTGEDGDHEALAADQVRTVPSPASLTEIGISFVEYDEERAGEFSGNRVLFDSLTTLLEHVAEERAFEFVDAFKGRFAASGYFGTWLMDAAAEDGTTVQQFREVFDVVVELRDGQDGRELRVVGLDDEQTAWTAFPRG